MPRTRNKSSQRGQKSMQKGERTKKNEPSMNKTEKGGRKRIGRAVGGAKRAA